MQHVNQIKAALGFSAVVSSVHSWSYKGTKDPITGKTAAQVALRWLLQSDVIIIPKTVHKERMQENLNLFDFELDADDMQKIAALDTAHSLFLDHHDGETTKQFMEWRAVVKPTE